MEDSTGQLQLLPQRQGIAEVAVVSHCQLALQVIDLNGLAVAQVVAPGGAVADMTHRQLTLGEFLQGLLSKDFPHQTQPLVGGEDPVVVHHNAAALLPPVLQGEEAVVDQSGHILLPGAEHTEDTAFLVNTHLRPSRLARMKPTNRGWGLLGRLLNSGWNCTPTWKGLPVNSTVSTRRPSGDSPLRVSPASVRRSR